MKTSPDIYAEAAIYYDKRPPRYKATVRIAPAAGSIALDLLYSSMQEAYEREPGKVKDFALTYGKLRVGTELADSATKVEIKPDNDYDNDFMEIRTTNERALSQVFTYPEQDSPFTYVLASGAAKTEMQIIKALHMFDAALVTGQLTTELPSVAYADDELLLELKQRYPSVFVRTYGNVRSITDAPDILGAVMPTGLLDMGGYILDRLPIKDTEEAEKESRERILYAPQDANNALIGITSAKTPHAGHLFLLATAMAGPNPAETVTIELNDTGPRVAAAIEYMAKMKGGEFADVAKEVASGAVSRSEVEQAYVNRDTSSDPAALPEGFALTDSNNYYRGLFQAIAPSGCRIDLLADSDVLPGALSQRSGYLPLYDGSTAVLKGESGAIVVVQEDKLTVNGLFAALIKQSGSSSVVDSPPLYNRKQLKVLEENGIPVTQRSGSAVKINFIDASGSKGGSISIDECMDLVVSMGLTPDKLLEVIRCVLNRSVLVKSDYGSLCPNFSSTEFLKQRIIEAAEDIQNGKVVELQKPISVAAGPVQYAKGISSAIGFPEDKNGLKLGMEQVLMAYRSMPVLNSMLSGKLLEYIADPMNVTMRKDKISPSDREILMGLATGNPKVVSRVLLSQLDQDQATGTTFGKDLISGTQLGASLEYMGYETDDVGVLKEMFGTLSSSNNRGVYLVS